MKSPFHGTLTLQEKIFSIGQIIFQLYIVTSLNRITSGDFEKFYNSLDKAKVQLYVGCRGFSPSELSNYEYKTKFLALPEVISISAARNQLLREFPPQKKIIVGFPDDDCWYGSETLSQVETLICNFDFLITDIQENIQDLRPTRDTLELTRLKEILKWSKSACIFISTENDVEIEFREDLGLGTEVGSGEDTELVLRLWLQGRRGVFQPSISVIHPKKDNEMTYFNGAICALRIHIKNHPRIGAALLRRMVSGLFLLLKNKNFYSQYKKSLSYVLRGVQ